MKYIEEIRALVVDDSDFFASLTVDQLETEHGIRAVKTTSGDEAIETVYAEPFDCVVSDYDMPAMNGLELYEQIRASGIDIPFILLTGRTDGDIVTEAIDRGVDDYIHKESVSQRDSFQALANRLETVASQWMAQQRYETIVESMPDRIAQVRRDGTILAANDVVAETYGLTPAEMVGKQIDDVLPAQIASQWRAYGDDALTRNERVTFEHSHDGRHAETIVVPVNAGRGTYQVIARDITARVERDM